MNDCIFCNKGDEEILCENQLAKAFLDQFPVNHGHVLVVPKRHIETFFDATQEELTAIQELIFRVREVLQEKFSPDGYNIGINVGTAGGQTIFHLHFHVIPRYVGDVENPRGGVRKIKKNIVPYPPEGLGERVYGKLVRDKIPEIIRSVGKEPVYRVASEEEFKVLLKKKLQEEMNEYFQSGDVDEIADLVEVISAILKTEGIMWADLMDKVQAKAESRGGFNSKLVLESVKHSGIG